MRIALDARAIYQPTRRGTGKNLMDLYRHLARLRPHWRVLALHRQSGDTQAWLPAPFAQARRVEIKGDRFNAWESWRLPWAAWRGGADVLHCPANTSPRWMSLPTLVTIHDLIPLDLPQGRTAGEVRRFARSIRRACRQAAWLICPSHYTADRLVDEFDADPRRITVNPWAPDSSMRLIEPEHWPGVLSRYGLERPFVIHFGAREPRKNTLRLVEAWASLPAVLRREWQLLIVGLDEDFAYHVLARATELDTADSVAARGFAHEADLPTLLSAAQVLAFPSLSEGYGLPIVDGWATHTAVLTSDCTSLPEVAGDAAVLIDPTDTQALAGGLERLMENAQLRRRLVRRGCERLCCYTWEATARRFAWTLEQIAGVDAGDANHVQREAA